MKLQNTSNTCIIESRVGAQPWPRLMKAETARSYLDLGPEVFRREIVPHVPAVILGGRRHYDKQDLDRWIESKLGRLSAEQGTDWLRHIDGDA